MAGSWVSLAGAQWYDYDTNASVSFPYAISRQSQFMGVYVQYNIPDGGSVTKVRGTASITVTSAPAGARGGFYVDDELYVDLSVGDNDVNISETSVTPMVGSGQLFYFGIDTDNSSTVNAEVDISQFDVWVEYEDGGGGGGGDADNLLSDIATWKAADRDYLTAWGSFAPNLDSTVMNTYSTGYMFNARYPAVSGSSDYVSGTILVSELPPDAVAPLKLGMYPDVSDPPDPNASGNPSSLGTPIYTPVTATLGVSTSFNFASPEVPFVMVISDSTGRTYFQTPCTFAITASDSPPEGGDFWTDLVGCTQ